MKEITLLKIVQIFMLDHSLRPATRAFLFNGAFMRLNKLRLVKETLLPLNLTAAETIRGGVVIMTQQIACTERCLTGPSGCGFCPSGAEPCGPTMFACPTLGQQTCNSCRTDCICGPTVGIAATCRC